MTVTVYAQKTDLSTVNSVKPKLGQKMAFEAAYKLHIAKFHKAEEKMNVFEILSGPNNGRYLLINGGRTFASMDNERADAAAHSFDLDKGFFPLLEEIINSTFCYLDSLSFHPEIKAEKFVCNVRHIKNSMLDDYRKELARGIKVLGKLKGPFWDNYSFNLYQQLWTGNAPVLITVRNLKDGFKSLEDNYYGSMIDVNPSYKDEYIRTYGTLDWDKRIKLLDEAVEKHEQYIMKLRKDLSSQ